MPPTQVLRKVLVSFVGHVDHGKSSILDKIRGTTVAEREAGFITQAIGASIIPIETVKRVCGESLKRVNIDVTIPGFLAIDTPGHAAFVHLRKRGGNLADIAVLVIDINEGIMPQTVECIEILKHCKTPFVIAANKIDLIRGWKSFEGHLIEMILKQPSDVQTAIDHKLYTIVGKLSELGFNSERFDRIGDYTKEIAIIPLSAKTGEGIPELLIVLTGLAQKFLEKQLEFSEDNNAKGTILEVKEEKGLGKTLDVIIYDGCLRRNDTIVIGGISQPIVAKIRALLEPAPLSEMRDKKSKFINVEKVIACTGVKISAPGTDDAVAGMPIMSASKEDIEQIKSLVQKQVDEVGIETDDKGIVIKADSLGSLEAMINLLRDKSIPIKRASIGNISKKDVSDAEANLDKDPLLAVILGFNVVLPSEVATTRSIKIITSEIIYRLIDELEAWQKEMRLEKEKGILDLLVKPCKIMILKGYVFRQSNPAIVGCEVLEGKAKVSTSIMNSKGEEITSIKSIQQEQESINEVEKGKQVAISFDGVIVGRQIKEGDILYSAVPEEHFRRMKVLKDYLKRDVIDLLKEIAEIKRKENPVWGI